MGKILSTLGRLIGVNAVEPTTPEELDTKQMGQVIAQLCGVTEAGRQLVRGTIAGELIVANSVGTCNRLQTAAVVSVVAAWTPFVPGLVLANDAVLAMQFMTTALTAFAPSVGGVPVGGYLAINAPPNVSNIIPFHWFEWVVQPLPLGGGLVGGCWETHFYRV